MASSFVRHALPKLIFLAAVLTVGVFLSKGDGSSSPVDASGNWSAGTATTLACSSGPVLCPSAKATSAVADVNNTLTIPGTDTNFSSVVTLGAQGSCVAGKPPSDPGAPGADCAAGARPNLGDVIGTLSSDTNLGLTNTPCSGFLIVTFVFLNATTDNSAGNLVNGSNQYEADAGGIQTPLLKDVYTVTPDDIQGNGNDVIGSASAASAPSVTPANGIPAHVERYPLYLNVVFDPDTPLGPALPVAPTSRYSGGQVVAGTSVILTLLNFAPGGLNAFNAPHPLADMDDANLGYASVSILQDPTRAPVTGSITDFCAPLLVNTTTFGETRANPCNGNTAAPCNTDIGISNPTPGLPTGRIRAQNPSVAGTAYWGGYHQSQRNSDGDPYENPLDTCPYAVNTENPKSDAGPDADMLDSVCDPAPAGVNNNQDGDTSATGGQWTNAQDNCPLVANGSNAQDELTELETVRRQRGGEQADGLGNECDSAESENCLDALDQDGDTLVNDGCAAVGAAEAGANCANAADDDADTRINDGCPLSGAKESSCVEAATTPGSPDDDGDGLMNDGCPTLGAAAAEAVCTFSTSAEMDNDFDGYPNDGCAAVGAPESGADCENYTSQDDDNGDTVITTADSSNDGCPARGGAELGCLNNSDDDADGAFNDGCPSSSRVANGHFHTTFSLNPICIGGTDGDNDGYCAAGTATVPADPADGNVNRIPETYSQFRPFPVAHAGSGSNPPASREPLQICNDGVDNDGDTLVDLNDGTAAAASTLDDCRPPDSVFTTGEDTDGDGARDEAEIHHGTDPLSRCAKGFETGGGPPPSSDWSQDLRGDGAFTGDKINVSDLGTYTAQGKNNKSPGEVGFDRRWDIRPGTTVGKWVGVADLAAISTQVPVPWMGVRAFGFFSVCSAHRTLGD